MGERQHLPFSPPRSLAASGGPRESGHASCPGLRNGTSVPKTTSYPNGSPPNDAAATTLPITPPGGLRAAGHGQQGREVTAAFGGFVASPTPCQEKSTPLIEAANSSHGESPVLSALFPWDSRVASVPRWKTLRPHNLVSSRTWLCPSALLSARAGHGLLVKP